MRKEELRQIFDFSREVTFRETAHTNYKHLEAMLLSPVATNSKLFSYCHGNCGQKKLPQMPNTLTNLKFVREKSLNFSWLELGQNTEGMFTLAQLPQ